MLRVKTSAHGAAVYLFCGCGVIASVLPQSGLTTCGNLFFFDACGESPITQRSGCVATVCLW